MCEVTKKNRIRYEYIRVNVGISSIMGKMKENRLRWSRHVEGIDNSETVRIVIETLIW